MDGFGDQQTQRHKNGQAATGGPESREVVSTIAERQFRLLVVAMVVISVPSLVINYYTAPPAVSSPRPDWARTYYDQFQGSADTYNERADRLYGVEIWGIDLRQMRSVLKNERINVYVTDASGRTADYSFVLDEHAAVRQLRRRARPDATLRVEVERATIDRIANEYTQTRAVREAYLDGEIAVTGVGASNWFQWWVLEQIVRHEIER